MACNLSSFHTLLFITWTLIQYNLCTNLLHVWPTTTWANQEMNKKQATTTQEAACPPVSSFFFSQRSAVIISSDTVSRGKRGKERGREREKNAHKPQRFRRTDSADCWRFRFKWLVDVSINRTKAARLSLMASLSLHARLLFSCLSLSRSLRQLVRSRRVWHRSKKIRAGILNVA